MLCYCFMYFHKGQEEETTQAFTFCKTSVYQEGTHIISGPGFVCPYEVEFYDVNNKTVICVFRHKFSVYLYTGLHTLIITT